MHVVQYAQKITEELAGALPVIDEEAGERLTGLLLGGGRVFVAGAGRSGLMGRAFAMRLMHLGLEAYVVGETVTPGIGAGDVLVLGSGSGETRSLLVMAEKAKSAGAQVALVTLNPASSIGAMADLTVRLPGAAKDREAEADSISIQPMGSLFEQSLLLFYDAAVLRMMELRGMETSGMYGKHANLE
ncbi:6-phospho-3-hexuloisomerase [Shouchella clausii]